MTIDELKCHCADLAKRSGPKASVWVHIRSDDVGSVTIYLDGKHLEDRHRFDTEDGLDAAFAKIEVWLASRAAPMAWWDDPVFNSAESLAAE